MPTIPATALYTIGHSTHDLETFIALLRESAIERVVDIRTVPRSRTNPQFNRDTLPAALAAHEIAYEHLAELGGLRGKSKTVAPDTNGYWENESFHHYADYALTDEFRRGLAALLARAHRQRCVIMCSEAVWWRCHRRIVADYVLVRGIPVFHIMGAGHVDPARPTPGAVAGADGSVTYPKPDAARPAP